jgi:diguanylate cyclase (GGDEF)-like protein
VRAVKQELHELRNHLKTDELTDAANRRYLEGKIHAAIAELAFREKMSTGLLFIDVDHFKTFNDTYGHNTGDKVLSMVASTLMNNVRKSDIVGRWGGEEFCAILYDVDDKNALREIAEKLRKLVAFSRLDIGNENLSVTISVGATLFLPTDTPESIIQRADELMYQSKQAGRNQVSIS